MSIKKSDSLESFYDILESPIGRLYLVCDGRTLRRICFAKPAGLLRKGKAPQLVKQELREYFERGRERFTMTVKVTRGTPFERSVWEALEEIPYGETRTYKWLAEKVGKPNASRAVGQALKRNPLPIVVPCHRIIESDGSPGGYAAGEEIKRRLLAHEYYRKLSKEGAQGTDG